MKNNIYDEEIYGVGPRKYNNLEEVDNEKRTENKWDEIVENKIWKRGYINLYKENHKEKEENSQLVQEEKIKQENKLKSDPLETEKSKEIMFSNGESVSDYIQKKIRGRSKKLNSQKGLELRKQLEKTKSENRLKDSWYTLNKMKLLELNKGHIERDKRNKRKTLTVQEYQKKYNTISLNVKDLMKNLGVTHEELIELVGINSVLSESEKAQLLSNAYFRTSKILKGQPSVKYTSFQDTNILLFLYKFKLATTKTISLAMNRNISTINGQLKKMERMGLITKLITKGTSYIWRITTVGASVITDKTLYKKPGQGSWKSTLTVSYVAACLFSNKYNILNLSDFPYKGRLEKNELVYGEELVSEYEMKSLLYSLAKGGKSYRPDTPVRIHVEHKEKRLKKWAEWERNGRKGVAPSDEIGAEDEFILLPEIIGGPKMLIPDLVVRRPRGADGSPKNIAVEVEVKLAKRADLVKKMLSYKADKSVYEKVIYVTSSTQVAKQIESVCEEIDFDRYDIVPFIGENGKPINIGVTIESWDI